MKVQVSGQGPALVMIHGWGMHSGCWGRFGEQLSTRFTLHLVDLPGHGKAAQEAGDFTLADLTVKLLEALPQAAWLGWSLGGQIALAVAMRKPSAVNRLVLVGTNPCIVASEDWKCGMDAQLFAGFSSRLEQDPDATLDQFNSLQVAGAAHASQTLKTLRVISSQAPPSLHGLRAGLRVLAEPGLESALPGVRTPTLLVGGSADRLVPLEAMRRTTQAIPGAGLAIIEGAGHAPFISHGNEVFAAVTDFLTQEKAA